MDWVPAIRSDWKLVCLWYGHEMNETVTPLETGLGFCVKFSKEEFIGKEALEKSEPVKTRVGLKVTGRGIVREHMPVFSGDTQVGMTTSGTHAPYLGYPGSPWLL